ncbi:ryanodine receptor-like isoform X2 [Gordionus sp. m RMFG-2023]|uniref:ryanodine receptor-like isoform X2 n=1 Tax=Gordionus sp. m RMFG-2023 TaxID=3053472 RepID=UPI0031FE1FE7
MENISENLGSETEDVSFLRTNDMVTLCCIQVSNTGQNERLCLAAEGFGNRNCYLENLGDKSKPVDMSVCAFTIEQALSVRALQELLSSKEEIDKTGSQAHRTLLYGHAVLLKHSHSKMYLSCLSSTSSMDKLAFDVGLKDKSRCTGESSWWTVHPASKQRSEGEKVRIGDDLILISVSSERYLHTVKNKREDSQVIASFSQTIWSIGPYSSGNIRNKYVGYVFGGQVLRVFHGQDECLTVSNSNDSQLDNGIRRNSRLSKNLDSNSDSARNSSSYAYSPSSQANSTFAAFHNTSSLGNFSNFGNSLKVNPISSINKASAPIEQVKCVMYESGEACHQARSLWQLEYLKTKYNGGLMGWASPLRLKHLTSGDYLALLPANMNRGDAILIGGEFEKDFKGSKTEPPKEWNLSLVPKVSASHKYTLFCLRPAKDDKKVTNLDEDKEEESMGTPVIKYGDVMVFIQHVHTGLWLSYEIYETKKKGIGRVEEKKAVMLEEGHMDDGFTFTMALEEEARSARVIRKSTSIFEKFLNDIYLLVFSQKSINLNLNEMQKFWDDLIDYFATPSDDLDNEKRQIRLKALKNRQDLFQEEGIISVVLEAIDRFSSHDVKNRIISLMDEREAERIDYISNQLYTLLAAIIRGNRANCAQFAQGNRLNWLFDQLENQQASKGALDVLQYILVDSPEVLNMITVDHIKVIISMLYKQGRDPKILNVLCSLCVGNGIAVRNNQRLIYDHLIPPKNILLQTKLIHYVVSMRANIEVGVIPNCSMYTRWYYEVLIDHVPSEFDTLSPDSAYEEDEGDEEILDGNHLRIGWGNNSFPSLFPGSGPNWGSPGVGGDYFSYGFDGNHLWTGGQKYNLNKSQTVDPGFKAGSLKKGDIVGCLLDLTVPHIKFTVNGQKVMGEFRNFAFSQGMFFPMVSLTSKISARFMFGDDQGKLKHGPPPLYASLSECRSWGDKIKIVPIHDFGNIKKGLFNGPYPRNMCDKPFVPNIIPIAKIIFPVQLEDIKKKLAENLHELWAKSKIEQAWIYGTERSDSQKTHPYLISYENLPAIEKTYDLQQALDTFKYIMALGYNIILKNPNTKIKIQRLPINYQMSNSFKPAPLDLTGIPDNPIIDNLTLALAENLHNIWAQDRISNGWSYGPYIDDKLKRTPFLLAYKHIPKFIKQANEEIAQESIKTIIAYGGSIEIPPEGKEKNIFMNTNSTKNFEYRTFRAEKTYAVAHGKWYYEIEVLSKNTTNPDAGPYVKCGWASPNCSHLKPLGMDELSYILDCHTGHKWHDGSGESFNSGKVWRADDVIGCLVDLHDLNVVFTVNGEPISDLATNGNELAFESINPTMEGGYIPVFSLGVDQRVKLNFGNDVRTLKYFTNYGLKEGYEPFGVNMSRNIPYWVERPIGVFENVRNAKEENIVITKIPSSGDVPPSFKITAKPQSKVCMNYIRLNLPIVIGQPHPIKRRFSSRNSHKPSFQFESEGDDSKSSPSKETNSRNSTGNLNETYVEPDTIRKNKFDSKRDELISTEDDTQSQDTVEKGFTEDDSRSDLPTINIEDMGDISNSPDQTILSQISSINADIEDSHIHSNTDPQEGASSETADFTSDSLPSSSATEQQSHYYDFNKNSNNSNETVAQKGTNNKKNRDKSESAPPDKKKDKDKKKDGGKTRSKSKESKASKDSKDDLRAIKISKLNKDAKVSDVKGGEITTSKPKSSRFVAADSIDVAELDSSTEPRLDTNAKETSSKRSQSTSPGSRTKSFTDAMDHKIIVQNEKASSPNPKKSVVNYPVKKSLEILNTNTVPEGHDGFLMKTFRKSFRGAKKRVGEMAEKISAVVPDVSDSGYAKGYRKKISLKIDIPNTANAEEEDQNGGDEEGSKMNGQQIVKNTVEPDISSNYQFSNSIGPRNEVIKWKELEDFYFGVRIYSGQNFKSIYVGWITPLFNHYYENFNFDKIRYTEIRISGTGPRSINETYYNRDCVLINVANLQKHIEQEVKISTSVLVGCYINPTKGKLRFTLNGKDSDHTSFKVDLGLKLYPAVFFETSSTSNKEILKIELGGTNDGLPLSSFYFNKILNVTKENNNDNNTIYSAQCPPRLNCQILNPKSLTRVSENFTKVHCLKLSNSKGWSMLADDSDKNWMAIKIPEENRCLDILELNEYPELLDFHYNTMKLFCALCSHGNTIVSHMLCQELIDQRQFIFCLQSMFMPGSLRNMFTDLMIAMFIEPISKSFELTKDEYIIPLTKNILSFKMFKSPDEQDWFEYFLKSKISISFKPKYPSTTNIQNNKVKDLSAVNEMDPPPFPLLDLKKYALSFLKDSLLKGLSLCRDPIGGNYTTLYGPLLKVCNKLILMGYISTEDMLMLLTILDPKEIEGAPLEYKTGGLIDLNLDESVKLEICLLLKNICDLRLRFKIESIIGFSEEFCRNLQRDQMYRYHEIKNSDLPAPLAAKMTKEFRCPPITQMQSLLSFKKDKGNISSDILDEAANDDNCHLRQEQRLELITFYESLLKSFNMTEGLNLDGIKDQESVPLVERIVTYCVEKLSHQNTEDKNAQSLTGELTYDTLCDLIIKIMIKWAKESHISDPNLVREIFALLYRQYNQHQEVYKALQKTYTIKGTSSSDFKSFLNMLVKIRSLLNVQMDISEEKIMFKGLWELANNKIFFQHPNLIRLLGVHENVIEVMINTLSKMSGIVNLADDNIRDSNCQIITACCRFLCFFCRTGAKNQQAMFEHLSYMLDHATMLLDKPSLRGSTPLDVAYSSFLENTELCLALNESHLEKVILYLARCGVQSNSKLAGRGYPDIGWDPVEGERFLDFLKYSVWVNGESLEENANLIIRLLIRKPESLGPALRGQSGGLLKAMKSAIKFSYETSPIYYDPNDEDSIDLGKSILTFYSVLIELLGKCAIGDSGNIDTTTSEKITNSNLKAESLRARAILRSLVALNDLKGILSLRFRLPSFYSNLTFDSDNVGGEKANEHPMPPGLTPDHKASIVLFLERVYGVPDQETLFHIMENGFLLDMRQAIILDSENASECDLALALNRYLCNVVFTFLVRNSEHLYNAEPHSALMNTILLTTYRYSLCHSLTKNQRNSISEFLLCFVKALPPKMLYPLLKKCSIDMQILNEFSFVPLRVLTWFYRNNRAYYFAASDSASSYSTSFNTETTAQYASGSETKIATILFYVLFDALAQQEYNHDLFKIALPCLIAIASALPPDYSVGTYFNKELEKIHRELPQNTHYSSNPVDVSESQDLSDYEFVIQKFAEHYHNSWASRKFEKGWSYNHNKNDEEKGHPRLKSFEKLSDYERKMYTEPIRNYIKTLIAQGWKLDKIQNPDNAITTFNLLSRRRSSKAQESDPYYFNPKMVDMSNMTLSSDIEDGANNLAENAHEAWAYSFENDMQNKRVHCSVSYVPYDLLTEKEKRKEYYRVTEFLKYLQLSGYKISNFNQEKEQNKIYMGSSGIQNLFSWNLLDKCLTYMDNAIKTIVPINASQRFSRNRAYRTTTKDVKFFFEVVLPLAKAYFQAHQAYFISKLDSSNYLSSNNDKEILCKFMCKLAAFVRDKYFAFGPHIPLAVTCLQAIINAIDFGSICKLFPDLLRTSLTPFFQNSASDLGELVNNLTIPQFSDLKINFGKGNSTLYYVQGVLYPILTTLFNHFYLKDYGKDILIDDIQILAYKILVAFYTLSKISVDFHDYPSLNLEMNNHRPNIGICLATFSNCFPVAFLEPTLNKNNRYSVVGRLQEHSYEEQDILNKLSTHVPTLENLFQELADFMEKGANYEDSPDMVDVLIPMLCSYMSTWWNYKKNHRNQHENTTMLNIDDINNLTLTIFGIIDKNIGRDTSSWMPKISGYANLIVSYTTKNLSRTYLINIMTKLRDHAELLGGIEGRLKYESADQEEMTEYEMSIQEDYMLLIRDIYTVYVLLITYIDMYRTKWLREDDTDAGKLFVLIAQIFKLWIVSQNFRRYEQNFLMKINANKAIKLSKTSGNALPDTTTNKSRNIKKYEIHHSDSLVITSLKRIIPVGLNAFDGKEQELIQNSKEKLLQGNSEENVMEWIKQQIENNQKTIMNSNSHKVNMGLNWQTVLYNEIGKASRVDEDDSDLSSIEKATKIYEIAYVIYQLHKVEHPPPTIKHSWQSLLSSPRKKAVVACFRMIALHSLPRHKVINIFLLVFNKIWLSNVDPHEEKLIQDLQCIRFVKKQDTMSSDNATSNASTSTSVNRIEEEHMINFFRTEPLLLLPKGNVPTPDQSSHMRPASSESLVVATIPASGGTTLNQIDETVLQLLATHCDKVEFNALTHLVRYFYESATSRNSTDFASASTTTVGAEQGLNKNVQTSLGGHDLYLSYCVLMSKSCGGPSDDQEEDSDKEAKKENILKPPNSGLLDNEDEDKDDQEISVTAKEPNGNTVVDEVEEETTTSYQDQEAERLRLLSEQLLLAKCGLSEMILLYIGASKCSSEIIMKRTLELGISILKGGNTDIQRRMLKYLQEKKDVDFFTSTSSLISRSTVLDLEGFERNIKAESLGVDLSDSIAGKNMEDYELTRALFRFLQLLCEGHNLNFQNYLRTQIGNTTTVNIVVCTVDYLLRLQESIMDFYWHYSGKSSIDKLGVMLFTRGIEVSKQVFNTLTEMIQGPCLYNQLALAHSRLWDAISGYFFLFTNMQNKLSKDVDQMELLTEFLELQKDMIIMMLSILEGNIMNGTIGKQMVDTLMESSSNIEMILKYFDMFLKLSNTIQSPLFLDYDPHKTGTIFPKDFKRILDVQKTYSQEEIDFLIKSCGTNKDGKMCYSAFNARFEDPSKDIGFNLAVLLTNLQEHVINEPRFTKFLVNAESFLKHFEPFLGRIEIMGSSNRIERVYFEIKQCHIDQWEKPQIKMKHATNISTEEELPPEKRKETIESTESIKKYNLSTIHPKTLIKHSFYFIKNACDFSNFRSKFSSFKKRFGKMQELSAYQKCLIILSFIWNCFKTTVGFIYLIGKVFFTWVSIMMKGYDYIVEDKNKEDTNTLKFLMSNALKKPMKIAKHKAKWDFIEDMETPIPSSVFGIELTNRMQERVSLPSIDEIDELDQLYLSEHLPKSFSFVKKISTVNTLEEDTQARKSMNSQRKSKEMIIAKNLRQAKKVLTKPSGPKRAPMIDNKKLFGFVARNYYNIKYIALALAFAINFLLLFFKVDQVPLEEKSSKIDASNLNLSEANSSDSNVKEYIRLDENAIFLSPLIQILCVTHIFVSLAMLIGYYYLKVPLSIFKREKEICRQLEFEAMWIDKQPGDEDFKDHWDKLVINTNTFPRYYWDKLVKKKVLVKYSETHDVNELRELLGLQQESQFFDTNEVQKIKTPKNVDWKYEIWHLGITLTDNSFLYIMIYFIFSVMGNFNHFFFAAHLLDIAIGFKTLRTILQSVTHNGKQLLLTVMMTSIVVYIYTVIAFNFFRKFYIQEEDGIQDSKCHNMLSCFVFHLYKGVRSGGGIGDEISAPDGDPYEAYRIIFDITFFFFVIIILLAIMQGLIIDAFGELRDQLEQVKDDMESNCFICGIGKDYFEKIPHGFEIHTKKEHDLANYMFFFMHLINKPETEFTGQETYVWRLYQQRCWDFFPVGDCFRKQYEEHIDAN